MKEIIIATKNPGKAREFKRLFDDQEFVLKTLLDLPEFPEIRETGKTFEENATIKAHAVMQRFNLPTIADDSGLQVDALFGQPGVRSARYAGDHNDAANNAKLSKDKITALSFQTFKKLIIIKLPVYMHFSSLKCII